MNIKPCEYCGATLPLGVDKRTRRARSFHFASCEKRPKHTPPLPDIEAQRKPLTDEEINALDLPPSGTATVRDLVRLIERAHGIGGGNE